MTESRSHPDPRGLYTRRLVLLVLVLVAGFLAWSSWSSYQDFVRNQQVLARQSAVGAARIISLFIEEAQRVVGLVAEGESDTLSRLSQDPENETWNQRFEQVLGSHLTGHFAFSIADPQGNVILNDLEGKVGEICQADILSFAKGERPPAISIHPNPLGYHFDIMAPWLAESGTAGILFVSFEPAVLAEILSGSESPSHRLMLVHRESPGLIEVAREGSRQDIGREFRLSDEERARVLFEADVPGTHWSLVDLPDASLFEVRVAALWRQAILVFLLFLASTGFMLWLIKGEEERRARAERALQKSHRNLEFRVRERTRQLSDTNVQLKSQIDQREQAEAALRESEQRYVLAVEGANDGIWDWKLPGQIYFSPRWKAMLGFSDDELSNDVHTWFGRVHQEDRRTLSSAIARIQSSLSDDLELEYRMRHRNGGWRWFRCRGKAVRDSQGLVVRIAGSQGDINERKRAETQLIHDAFHDALTGLPNRALFLDRLDQAVQLASREDRLLAVLFLDLDRFKLINDSLGHAIGDQLLVAVAERISGCIRPGDTLARPGGDEFTILLESIADEDEAGEMAARVQSVLQEPFDIAGQSIYTTVSVGIAFSGSEQQEPGGLLRDADIAMYRAKAKGKARHEVFEEEVRTAILAGLHLETDLRQALEHEQFRVFYQPIVSVGTGRLRGFEALIRWVHPERGLVLPDEFIPAAEETGLIVPIGAWVLETACEQMRDWQLANPERSLAHLSVNLSSRQFLQEDLLATFESVLNRTGLEDCRLALDLEITESVLMENAERSAEILARLKRLGVHLSIDDFGTGYSSLSYLRQFPVDTLKIDRSFVRRIDSDKESREIVQAMIGLAHNLDLQVVAEGVEKQAHLEALRQMGCDWAQGYYFARTMSAEDAEKLMLSDPQWGNWPTKDSLSS